MEHAYSPGEYLALINERLARTESKIDAFILNVEGRLSTIEAQAPFRAQVATEVGELATRIRALEEFSIRQDAFAKERRRIIGGSAGAATLAVTIIELVRSLWIG